MADSFGFRSIEDRNEELHQDYTGRPREIALRRYADYVQGKTQEALGRQIVRNTPGDIELAAIREKYPSMTKGVPLDQLHELWKLLQNDNNNTARKTDAKDWSPRDYPDTGLTQRPKDIEREMEDARTPQAISAPRGVDPRQPGFTMNYQPTPQAKALGNVIAALQDERLGMVPGIGAIRGMRLLKPVVQGPEMGGFNVASSTMRRELGGVRPNLMKMEPPDPQMEKNLRADYLGTVTGHNELAKHAPAETLVTLDPRTQQTYNGLTDLMRHNAQTMFFTPAREGPPTPEMMRRFGFDGAQERAEINKILRESRRSYLSER
jgi:hypothetical protein